MALASISHELPEALIAESLTQKLVCESGRRVLWLQLADATMPGPENFIALGEPRFNGDHDFTRSIERLASGVGRLSLRIAGDSLERNQFRLCWILPEIIFAMS